MEINRGAFEDQLLAHAARQTKALETIRTVLVWMAGLLAVVGGFWLLAVYAGLVS